MAALAVVAEINAESTIFITIKLIKIDPALLPNFRINHKANLLATPVATSILANTNDMMFSHITGCPSCAYDSFSESTPVSTSPTIKINEVR